MPRRLKPIVHGTLNGYRMELRRGIDTCGPCRAENARIKRLADLKVWPDRQRRTLAEHGTPAGYARHQREGTLAAADECGCRSAWARYQRGRRDAAMLRRN